MIPIRASGGATWLDDSSGSQSKSLIKVVDDPVYQFYKIFCLIRLPWVLLFLLGGWSFVVWGILSA